MTTSISASPSYYVDDSRARLDDLSELSQRVLRRCRDSGASQAEVNCSEQNGLDVTVRMGQTETIEAMRDRGVSITVYFGQRKGSASTADLRDSSLESTIAQACAIARYTQDDQAAGLAETNGMALEHSGVLQDFDGWHPWFLDADRAVDLALACEAAGRDVDARIRNSDGASVHTTAQIGVYANSHGFIGIGRGTSHSISCALIAGEGEQMQRDGWYTAGLAEHDLESPAVVGCKAARRTISRLAPRQVSTGVYPVVFSPEMARSLVGHFLGAISGGALYRRASFLLDGVNTQIFPKWFDIQERPHLNHGLRSAAFDAEGVATRESALVADGILQRYVLASYSARKLGLQTTANAGGVHNLVVKTNTETMDSMIRGIDRGLLVTHLMGQGVNGITGDYSRGASGFWIENGQIAHPVDGITIAGNLKTMFQSIEAVGADVDPRSHVQIGSTLIGKMTIAGSD